MTLNKIKKTKKQKGKNYKSKKGQLSIKISDNNENNNKEIEPENKIYYYSLVFVNFQMFSYFYSSFP